MTRDDAIEWALEKHGRIVLAIPEAVKDPWSLHGPESVCVGCLQLFVGEYLSDIPDVFAQIDEETDEVSWI